METHIFFLLESVDLYRGGLPRSVMRRASLFADRIDMPITLITLNFNPDYDEIQKELLRYGILHPKVRFVNLFESLAHKSDFPDQNPIIHHPIEENGLTTESVSGKNAYRLYKNGICVKYKEYDAEGRIRYIDYYDDKQLIIRREQYDRKGRLRRVVDMDPTVANKPRQTRFLDERGRCFLNVWYDPKTNYSVKVYWFDLNGNIIKSFSNETELRTYWLGELIKPHQKVLLHSELYITDTIILKQRSPNVAKIRVLHSNHLKEPYIYGSEVEDYYIKLFSQMDQFDAVIFMTNQQKQDVERQFGPRSILHAVPHAAPKIKGDLKIERDPLTCVYVGRFAKEKIVDHIIRAFHDVVKVVPGAKLEIWGIGPEKQNYLTLIHSLKLEQNVKVCEYTQNALEVFAKAAFSVFTSVKEGFGLTIAESMSVGTPVIAYDVNYGPREMITHGENGYLITPNDIDSLAKAMIELFTNQKKCKEMGEKARKITNIFSEEKFVNQWMKVYESAMEQKDHRVQLNKPVCTITHLNWAGNQEIVIEGTLTFDSELYEEAKISLYIRERTVLRDEYISLNSKKVSPLCYLFRGTFSVSPFMKNGIYDLYISCSVRNVHFFVQVPKGHIQLPKVRVFSGQFIQFNGTEHGNLAFFVAPKRTIWERIRRVKFLNLRWSGRI